MNVQKRIFPVLLCIALVVLSCSSATKSTGTHIYSNRVSKAESCNDTVYPGEGLAGMTANSTYILQKPIDLAGKTYRLPSGVAIISKGGMFCNGCLVGNGTSIEGDGCLFDNVKISGSWKVKNISTEMFKNGNTIDLLKDVFALASPTMDNHIVIGKGDYWVTAKAYSAALNIPSNTEIEIKGNIRLVANDYSKCYVIGIVHSENVSVTGKGTLFGDKISHEGTDGEWGHGIYVASSQNVSINNIGIRDCWGDCIYVGSNSKSIVIKDCTIKNGRRQGISVTYASDVSIEDCNISDVRGTRPGCGIDVEPNVNCRVDNVRIKGVRIINCYRGISVGGSPNAQIGRVQISECEIFKTEVKSPIVLKDAENVTIDNCTIETDTRKAVLAIRVQDVKIRDNRIKSRKKEAISINDCPRSIVSRNNVAKEF